MAKLDPVCYASAMPDAARPISPAMLRRPRRARPGALGTVPRRRLPSTSPAPTLGAIPARSAPHALLLALAELAPQRADGRVREGVLVDEAHRRAPQRFGKGEGDTQVDHDRARAGLAALTRYGLARCDRTRRWHVTARVRAALRRWRQGESDDVLAGRFGRYGRARRMAARVDARLAREAAAAREPELRDAA